MASADSTKRVLAAILHWLPDDGPGLLAKLEIRGLGRRSHVRLSCPTTRDLAMRLHSVVEEALEGFRHRVEIEWDPVDASRR